MGDRSRGNGEGTIFEHGKGRRRKWKVQFSGGRNPLTGKRIRITRTVAKHADAVALLQRLRGSAPPPVNQKRLGAWLVTWLAGLDVQESAARSASDAVAKITKGLGHHRVSDVTPAHIDEWLTSLEEGRSKQIVFDTLNRALKHAARIQIRHDNPCANLPRPKAQPAEPRPFTQREAKAIIEHAKENTPRLAPLVILALATGMRQGELFGLLWSDVNLRTGAVTIRQQARSFGGKVTPRAKLKTNAAYRSITLPPVAVQALRSHQAASLRVGDEKVFAAPEGGWIGRDTFRERFWRPLLKTLGIAHRGFHQTRHTYATHALSAGVPINIVAGILGHTNPATTLRMYARWIPTDQATARDASQRLLG